MFGKFQAKAFFRATWATFIRNAPTVTFTCWQQPSVSVMLTHCSLTGPPTSISIGQRVLSPTPPTQTRMCDIHPFLK